MKKHPRLSLVSAAIATASLMLASNVSLAAHNYKGDYKNEAIPCPAPRMLRDGIYLGAQVGYDSYRVRETFNLLNYELRGNPAIANNGWVGGLFLGYGQYLTDLFYLGGEIFGSYNGSSQSYTVTDWARQITYNSKIRVRGSWGLALLPGLRLNDGTLGYIRLGYNWANLKSSENVTAPLPPPVTNAGNASASKSNTSNGFNFGVGMETLLWDDWSLRGEYSHTWYNSFTSGLGTKFNPSNSEYMLGLIYHFA